MFKAQNILISGGNGLLGKSICTFLLNQGHNVVVGDKYFNLNKKRVLKKIYICLNQILQRK